MQHRAVLSATQMYKSFGGAPVVRGVDIELYPGETHALVGENGAGKSTLINILSGFHRPDTGRLEFDGENVVLSGPASAHRLGIFTVHQEPALMPELSVAENVFMGFHPTRRVGLNWVDRNTMNSKVRLVFEQLGVSIDVREMASKLTIAQQQIVEIAKALIHNMKVLILDEPTATLSAHESNILFSIVRQLESHGVAILFISHRLDEVFQLSKKVTVMRDGEKIGTYDTNALDEKRLVSLMVGRDIDIGQRTSRLIVRDKPLLEVSKLSKKPWFEAVSFQLYPGEILGMAGLIGAGRTNVAEALFGIAPPDNGEISINGTRIKIRNVREAMYHGIAYVPEDRHKHGLALPMSVMANSSLPNLRALSKMGFINPKREIAYTDTLVRNLNVRLSHGKQAISQLSGGNQQKVVFGKWISLTPSIVILDEPTRGVDIGAKSEIYKIIGEIAERGTAVLLISSDLPEVITLSDRVMVMREGRIVSEVHSEDITEEKIMQLATGMSETQLPEGAV